MYNREREALLGLTEGQREIYAKLSTRVQSGSLGQEIPLAGFHEWISWVRFTDDKTSPAYSWVANSSAITGGAFFPQRYIGRVKLFLTDKGSRRNFLAYVLRSASSGILEPKAHAFKTMLGHSVFIRGNLGIQQTPEGPLTLVWISETPDATSGFSYYWAETLCPGKGSPELAAALNLAQTARLGPVALAIACSRAYRAMDI